MADLLKDLSDVVQLLDVLRADRLKPNSAPLTDTEAFFAHFINTHHATIQQNAEAALRLRALEQALREREGVIDLRDLGFSKRAAEILRERDEGKGE